MLRIFLHMMLIKILFVFANSLLLEYYFHNYLSINSQVTPDGNCLSGKQQRSQSRRTDSMQHGIRIQRCPDPFRQFVVQRQSA